MTEKKIATQIEPAYTPIDPIEADTTIKLRKEQEEAIQKALKYFEKNPKNAKFLWNAKMRFGKTICALELAKRMGKWKGDQCVRRTIIVTHRPVVNASWKEDFQKVFDKEDNPSYHYATKFDDSAEGDFYALSQSVDHENEGKDKCHLIFFASMQYLRSSTLVGGKNEDQLKKDILNTDWDLVVIDEAHEGTQTTLGENVIHHLTQRPHTKALHLSGTPFNLYEDFSDKEIYTWDYIKEQEEKAKWDKEKPEQKDKNPYRVLPQMRILTYNLGNLRKEDLGENASFELKEFFRVLTGEDIPAEQRNRFAHEADVKQFIELLRKEDAKSNYPFSNNVFRKSFNHTLWVLPGVKEAKALEKLLKEDEVFSCYDIINVAGNNDDDEVRQDALDKVKNRIGYKPDQTYTITLSCGRLTTGVTVPEWTAVFYLKGSEDSAAATYMQTIFRVQSPHTFTDENGKCQMKTNCYVFDFAPDRTLKMVAATAKFSALTDSERKNASATSKEQDLEKMQKFLNFCPVIALDGSVMKAYDAEKLFDQLNHVYIDRVVQNGFNDNCLYDIKLLMGLSPNEVEVLNEIGDKVAQSSNMEKPPKALKNFNNSGLSKKQKGAADRAEEKQNNGEQLTQEEKDALEEKKKRQAEERKERDNRIAILRGISLRIPLMMFGAELTDEEEGITLDNFTQLIDNDSWAEFMPRGITKAEFNKLKKCYNASIFVAAGKRYRQMTREADEMSITERIEHITSIFSYFHNPDKETVLTPWRVVNMHLNDCFGGYTFFNERFDGPVEKQESSSTDDIITHEPRFVDRGDITHEVFAPDAKILEINSKTGLYPLYMAYSLFRQRKKELEAQMGIADTPDALSVKKEHEIWDDVVRRNIFVICNTPMAKRITERTLLGFLPNKDSFNIKQLHLIRQATQNPKSLVKNLLSEGFWLSSNNTKKIMNFNAVVGNPPYQIVNKGNGNGADPIYHTFIDMARAICPRGTLIHPARFLFNAGKTPKDWNQKFLNDPHVKVIDYWANSMEVFPSVDVKGGIAVTYWDKNKDFGAIKFFSVYNELHTILQKVQSLKETSFSTVIAPRELYGLTEDLYKEHPELEGRQSKGHKFSLGANIFDVFPELFEEDTENVNKEGKAKIYGRFNNQRCYKWMKDTYINHPNNYNCYKVIIPKSNGSGAIGEVLSTPVVGEPVVGYTDTFLDIGCYNTVDEAIACMKYVKTKFARTMLGTLKVTQDNPSGTWANVPLQDFTSASDIDWGKSITEIDQQLYKKYGLTGEEVSFIEKMIKGME